MMKKNRYLLLIINCLLSLRLFSTTTIESGIDHAPIDDDHIQDREIFINQYFKENGQYNTDKILLFLHRMQKELRAIESDVVETKIMEDIELHIKKPKKIVKKTKDSYRKNSHKVVIPYKQYLIPKIEKLLEESKKETCKQTCDAIVDDFIRGYYSYYLPNAYRSIFPLDTNITYAAKRLFVPFRIKKSSPKFIEANNLIVNDNQSEVISYCLSKQITAGHYLLNDEVKKLQQCQFDISTLDPGISPFWKKLKKDDKKNIHSVSKELFPEEDEPLIFEKLIYRGQGSPKFKAFFKRNGIKQKLKIKLGRETHVDKAVSKFGELIGLNQDQMLYKPYIKLYLGAHTFNEFQSLMINKYGSESAIRYIWGHGGKKGDEWVLFKDGLFEGRPKDELRLSTFDIGSWDFQNRREYRSVLLFWAWLGVNDTKLANFKTLFKRSNDGDLQPLLRLQDTGIGLGGEFNFRKIKNILSILQYYKVNAFPSSFMTKNRKKDQLKIHWNDFANRKRHFKSTTWNDLKWMARQILSITEQDIYQTLSDSGMPKEVVDIYAIKLKERRNQITTLFELTDEFPEYETPNLKTYNPSEFPGIKNGKVVKTVFENNNAVVQVQEKWLTLLPKLLTFDIPINFWKNKENKEVHQNQKLTGLNGISQETSINPNEDGNYVFKIPIGIGIQAIISRSVTPNQQLINHNGKNHLYKVTDHIKIKIGIESSFLKKIIEWSQFSDGAAHIRFFQKDLYHIQFSDSVKKAYLKPFHLIKIMRNIKKYASTHLNPLEIITSESFFGIDFSLGAGLYSVQPLIKNELQIGFVHKKLSATSYFSDQFGKLHITSDSLKQKGHLFNLNLVDINLFEAKLPLLKIIKNKNKYNYRFSDRSIENDNTIRDKTMTLEENKKKNYEIIGKTKKNTTELTENYFIETKGTSKSSALGLGFLFNFEKDTDIFEIKSRYDNQAYHFLRTRHRQMKNVGVEKLTIDYGQSDILVKSRRRTEVASEVDLKRKKKHLIIIRTEDFSRKSSLKSLDLLLEDLNERYSLSKETLFYRDYFIPEEHEVPHYRKIYALTKIYIDGFSLLRKIKNHSQLSLQQLIKSHFIKNASKKHLGSVAIEKLKRNIYKIIEKIKKTTSDKQQIMLLNKLVLATKTELFGLTFYKSLVGKKKLFVMGDIAGILRSYSALQTLQQQQIRRFAAHSWGELNKKSPIQQFLRHQRYARPSVFITKHLSDITIFGKLEVGVAKNIETIFDRNNSF